MFELVVSRYNENLDWIRISSNPNIKQKIYNKGANDIIEETILLPNIGREAQTWIFHILSNYDNLAEYTIFLQGNPFEHYKNTTEVLLDIPNSLNYLVKIEEGLYSFSDKILEETLEHSKTYFVYPDELYKKYFIGEVPNNYKFPNGAQYIVHKDNILSKSNSFYEYILKTCEWNDHGPWSIERLWPFIFSTKSSPVIIDPSFFS